MSYARPIECRAVSDARRGRHGDLRSRGRGARASKTSTPPRHCAFCRRRCARKRPRCSAAILRSPSARRERRRSAPPARAPRCRRHLFGDRRRPELRGLRNSSLANGVADDQDHHRQRRQHLYAQRRLLEQVEQCDAGRHARPDAVRHRACRNRRDRLRLVCRRRRLRDPAGDHHHQQRRVFVAAAHRATARERDRRRQFAQCDARLRRPAHRRLQPGEFGLCAEPGLGRGGNRHVPHRLGPRLGGRNRQHAGARCGTPIGSRRPCSTSTRRSRRTSPTSA